MQRESFGSVRIFYPEFDTEELVQLISRKLSALARELPLKLVVLFGSYAKRNYTVASDVDLLVVYAGRKREDDYAVVKRVLDIPRLEPHLYTEEEYEELREVLSRLIDGGIVLLAAETAELPLVRSPS